jgi:serine/threonine protein kinase
MDSNLTPTNQVRGAKYQILMELGRGGMGVVHLAMSRGPQGFTKLLVLKIMRKELVGDEDLHRMFLEEARISARLAHPNIVQLYEVSDFGGSPTIVMEYLEGQSLSSILANAPGKLPLPLHLHVLSKALAGLHAAHEQRDWDGTCLHLIHRDVSPHNIFVLFDGQVKVLDFGIAKAAGSEVETRTGGIKGKIRYMPPEQLMRDRLDRRADIFAMGAILWEALASKRLWSDQEEGDVTRSLLAKKIPALPDDAEIAPELRTICARALAPEPVDRYATAEDFQRDLERFLQEQLWPAGAEEVGAFLRAQFGELRETAKKVIDFHIKAAERMDSATGNTPSATSHALRRPVTGLYPSAPPRTAQKALRALMTTASPIPPPYANIDGATRAYPNPLAVAAGAQQPAPAHQRRRLLIAAAVAVLLLVASAGLLRATRSQAGVRRGMAGTGAASMTGSENGVGSNCAPGFKLCGRECVSIDRPDYGCGGDSCLSCRVVNATARCNQRHECDVAVCYQAFDDCDGESKNGCETNVRIDPDHCGGCGRRCPSLPHATRGCGDVCTIWACQTGFRDCNGISADGCEVSTLSDPANCGRCGAACAPGQKCRHGECSAK